ncbi:MAG: hypothetical protein ACJ790_20870 [Myxococcaceae bacterium]
MSCPDTSTLWSLEAGELHGDSRAATLAHALSCLACQSTRNELRETLSLLSVDARPAVQWSRVDAALDDVSAKEMLRRAGPLPLWKWMLPAGGFALLAAAVTMLVHSPAPVTTKPVVVAEVAAAPVMEVTAPKPIAEVQSLHAGKQRLTFSFGSGGHGELGPHSSATVDGSLITLSSGTLIASAERELVIHAGAVSVKGDGRVKLSVSQSSRFFEVAVSDGAVLVERADAQPVWIHQGESVRFDRAKGTSVSKKADVGAQVKQRTPDPGVEKSSEELFLGRAEHAVQRGSCGDFLLGLETLAFDAEEEPVRERARIVKARCHDARVEPDKAGIEYRRYLRDFPTGNFAEEARKAVQAE